jgi:hypothetical protein
MRERYDRSAIVPLMIGGDDPETASAVKAAYAKAAEINPFSIFLWAVTVLFMLIVLTAVALGAAWVFWLLIGLFP